MDSKFETDRETPRGGRAAGVGNRGLDMKLKKCDVRLTKEEDQMLDYLAERNEETRSSVMRRALRDMFKFNTEE